MWTGILVIVMSLPMGVVLTMVLIWEVNRSAKWLEEQGRDEFLGKREQGLCRQHRKDEMR